MSSTKYVGEEDGGYSGICSNGYYLWYLLGGVGLSFTLPRLCCVQVVWVKKAVALLGSVVTVLFVVSLW